MPMSDQDWQRFGLALLLGLVLRERAGVGAVSWEPGGFMVWALRPAAVPPQAFGLPVLTYNLSP